MLPSRRPRRRNERRLFSRIIRLVAIWNGGNVERTWRRTGFKFQLSAFLAAVNPGGQEKTAGHSSLVSRRLVAPAPFGRFRSVFALANENFAGATSLSAPFG